MLDAQVIKTASSLCGSLYGYAGTAKPAWTHYDDGADSDKICWSIAREGDLDFVILRGSTTFIDWQRDFDAWADPFHKLSLGHVHPGFLLGMEQILDEARPLIRDRCAVVVTGHSLGAARADILAGLMVLNGYSPIRVVFGEPKPGFKDFAAVISNVPSAAYCNGDDKGHDLVTDVPFSFPPEEYVHPAPLTSLVVSPAPNDDWGVFRYHHWQLYDAAIQANT